MVERSILSAATSELRELGEYMAHRRDLQKLYTVELFILLGAMVAVIYTIDAGVLSIVEGMVILAVISVAELLVEAHITG